MAQKIRVRVSNSKTEAVQSPNYTIRKSHTPFGDVSICKNRLVNSDLFWTFQFCQFRQTLLISYVFINRKYATIFRNVKIFLILFCKYFTKY